MSENRIGSITPAVRIEVLEGVIEELNSYGHRKAAEHVGNCIKRTMNQIADNSRLVSHPQVMVRPIMESESAIQRSGTG